MMKRVTIGLILMLLLAVVTIAYSQGQGGWGMGPGMMYGGHDNWNYCPYCGQNLWQRGGYGMGPGMMGGCGMAPGMMVRSMMGLGYYQSEECQKFLDETVGLRKELYNKRFEYFEAQRNPKTDRETVTKLEKEVRELQEKIYTNAPRSCW